MKILSVVGDSLPAGKGGSPSDTFDHSTVTYQVGKDTKTLTVTYVRYFATVLAEKGMYDQEKEGVPVNKLAGLLFLEKFPNAKESRHYFNDEKDFLPLFEGFSLAKFQEKYSNVTLVS
ncbi:hypothetical protein ACQCN2_17850 [Brevibacillus ginsengisoli]|uniref:hypothetical protein n=1 Tax=Brevibacillus ginsengisoli TaxID=363854 RepID=UPI003CF31F65